MPTMTVDGDVPVWCSSADAVHDMIAAKYPEGWAFAINPTGVCINAEADPYTPKWRAKIEAAELPKGWARALLEWPPFGNLIVLQPKTKAEYEAMRAVLEYRDYVPWWLYEDGKVVDEGKTRPDAVEF